MHPLIIEKKEIRYFIPLLEDVLNYENENVLSAFLLKYRVTKNEALDIFHETKKFLWVFAKAENEQQVFSVDVNMLMIDEMWHNFILCTPQYVEFCQHYFGNYIHHRSLTRDHVDKLESNMQNFQDKMTALHEEITRATYSYVYDHLGAQTLVKWYEEFAEKYTPAVIKSLDTRYEHHLSKCNTTVC